MVVNGGSMDTNYEWVADVGFTVRLDATGGGLQSPWTFRFVDVNGDASDELLVTSQSNEILAFAGDTGDFLGVYANTAETPYDLEARWDGTLLVGTAAKDGGNVFLFGAGNR